MRPFFNLCIPCSLQIARRNKLCLHLRMVSFCILISWVALLLCFAIASGVSVCQILQSPKSIVLLYAILLTSCIFPLDLNSFSVQHYNTVSLFISVVRITSWLASQSIWNQIGHWFNIAGYQRCSVYTADDAVHQLELNWLLI